MFPKIIDTHLHVWDFNYATYEWLKGNNTLLNRNYHIEEISEELLQANVVAAVLVQAANNFEDTDRMLFLASQTNWVAGVVGWLPLMDPDATYLALSQKYLVNNYFKGVRHLINDEANEYWLLQPSVVKSLELLQTYNIPYDLVGMTPVHIETALQVAEKVPGLRMVFDHLNQPPIVSNQQFGHWGKLMKEAACHRNFFAKISGLGTASGKPQNWNEKDLAPYVDFILEQFGEDRCFCGSDWPVSLQAGSYTKHWLAYRNILEQVLGTVAMEKVLYSNAMGFYDLTAS